MIYKSRGRARGFCVYFRLLSSYRPFPPLRPFPFCRRAVIRRFRTAPSFPVPIMRRKLPLRAVGDALEEREESVVRFAAADALVQSHGQPPLSAGVTYADLLRRGIPLSVLRETFGILQDVPADVLLSCETQVRYEGYLKRSRDEAERAKKMEQNPLPPDLDYSAIAGLRLEAREKLARIRPLNLGQAERISGVSPADIAVLMVYLSGK